MKAFRPLIVGIGVLVLSGCTLVGPDYKGPPESKTGDWFRGDAEKKQSAAQPVDPKWWDNFNDPALTHLLEKTANENFSVRVAAANIKKARGALNAARAGWLPSFAASGSFSRARRSENSEFAQFPGFDVISETWKAGLDAQWELDLFGRTQRRVEAGQAEMAATVYTLQDTLITAQAETARAYMELRAAQQLTEIAKAQAQLQEKTASLVEKQLQKGQASEYQLARIKALAINTRAQIPQSRARAKAAVYALGFLTGQPPEQLLPLLEEQQSLPELNDPVHIGMRADMLRRRPDVKIAERNLAARAAEVGAAMADLFPSVSLTGRAGFESLQQQTLFDAASRTWLINPAINIPIFNRGEIRANIKIAEVDQDIARIEYEQAVSAAVREAQESLTTYAESLDALSWQYQALEQTQKMQDLANIRYQKGEDDLLDLSDAQERLLESRQAVVNTKLMALNNLIALYKALGGGWLPHDAETKDEQASPSVSVSEVEASKQTDSPLNQP